MDTKITITLDSSLKEEMVKYAAANKQSISSFVSKLINSALQTKQTVHPVVLSEEVKSIMGIIPSEDDWKASKSAYLEKKYKN
jgi:hypothetical protein